MFSAASTSRRRHPTQLPQAGQRRHHSTSSNPAGKVRSSAAVKGRSGGSSSVVTM